MKPILKNASIKKASAHFILWLLPILLFLQFGQASFVHYHVSKNGALITHSHPYQSQNKSKGKKSTSIPAHKHSKSELLALQLFDGNVEDFIGSLLDGISHSDNKKTRLFISTIKAPDISTYQSNTLRGPPYI